MEKAQVTYPDKSQETYYWSDLADLTHETQVENFGFCTCEDNEGNENPYADCPSTEQTFQNLSRELAENV
jgi:hypothetical protein